MREDDVRDDLDRGQFLTYIASTGAGGEKYEIRYEKDAELDQSSVIQKIWTTGPDGKNYLVNHYNLQVIIALGFKIDNERAVQFRKWANQIVGDYTNKFKNTASSRTGYS